MKIIVTIKSRDGRSRRVYNNEAEKVVDVLNIVDYRPFVKIFVSDKEDKYIHSNEIEEITVKTEDE